MHYIIMAISIIVLLKDTHFSGILRLGAR